MGATYQAVQWNPQKRIYDTVLVLGVGSYLVLFVGLSLFFGPSADPMVLTIRAFGSGAFILLNLILAIGPLCRLNERFLPLLYNRRHLGVTTFLVGLAHAVLVVFYYHVGGPTNPLLSIFTSSPYAGGLVWLPFQPFGFLALFILFLMAATSHDFWLHNLTAPVWKALHMLVYVAYASLVIHVVLGILQSEQSPVYVAAVGIGLAVVLSLHVAAGLRGRGLDKPHQGESDMDGFVDVCSAGDIRDNRARIATLSGERVAVFKYTDANNGGTTRVCAVSNVCQHQNGPLGEGKVVDGCITCPWHGYQYLPQNGSSPPPFSEKIPTFRVKVVGGRILVDPQPLPAGTETEPATVES
jgi:nitrite reductase/ring-hydroxylating ferredoxin subunit/DMSO/TMAO reductase YedYZ heme-binding membrane subunit